MSSGARLRSRVARGGRSVLALPEVVVVVVPLQEVVGVARERLCVSGRERRWRMGRDGWRMREDMVLVLVGLRVPVYEVLI